MTTATELITWLRNVADPIDQQILNEVFRYEQMIDGEWSCCHSAEKIEAGECDSPDKLEAVRLVASRYANLAGYRDEWKPEVA